MNTYEKSRQTINKLATQANKMNSMNGAAIMELLPELVEKLGGDVDAIKTIAPLYKKFMPRLPAKPKNSFQWVSKAVCKKDARQYLKYVYCTGDDIVATDGHRLHVAKNDYELKKGYFYDANMNSIGNDIGTFPDYERLFIDVSKATKYKQSLKNDFTIIEHKSVYGNKSVPVYFKEGFVALDKTYIDFANLSNDEIEFLYINSNSAIEITNKYGKALVMPKRS